MVSVLVDALLRTTTSPKLRGESMIKSAVEYAEKKRNKKAESEYFKGILR